jgi:hypothetical protein
MASLGHQAKAKANPTRLLDASRHMLAFHLFPT